MNWSLGHNFAHQFAVRAVRRNERGDADHAGIGEELGHFADAADVFRAVLRRKAQVRAEPMADVVAIEDIDVPAEVEQFAFEFGGDGGFAGPGKSRSAR